jgi:hypothetical protein
MLKMTCYGGVIDELAFFIRGHYPQIDIFSLLLCSYTEQVCDCMHADAV